LVVYADVLIVLNIIVDYFLLKISSCILRVKIKIRRILAASFLGGLFSLYIFFPKSHPLAEIFVNISASFVISFVCFGFKNFKFFLKSSGIFFGVTCLYGGVMMALWQMFKPGGMVINNSVVYFNISPTVLIGFTVLGYFAYLFFSKIFASSAKLADRCEITIFADSKSVGATAIIDTGNSISDMFNKSEIIIADKAILKALFGNLNLEINVSLRSRYRKIPCSTVSGVDLLDGFRCDSAKVFYGGRAISLEKPIVAIAKADLKENYSAILNPKILDVMGDKTDEKFMV